MENATKALIIVAGVLIGIMIISLGAALFFELENYVQATNEKMEANAQNAFNTQFINFVSENLRIHDVITVASLAYENNIEHNALTQPASDPSLMFVAVYLNGERIDYKIKDDGEAAKRLQQNITVTYKCTHDDLKISEITGRVYEIHFWTK